MHEERRHVLAMDLDLSRRPLAAEATTSSQTYGPGQLDEVAAPESLIRSVVTHMSLSPSLLPSTLHRSGACATHRQEPSPNPASRTTYLDLTTSRCSHPRQQSSPGHASAARTDFFPQKAQKLSSALSSLSAHRRCKCAGVPKAASGLRLCSPWLVSR